MTDAPAWPRNLGNDTWHWIEAAGEIRPIWQEREDTWWYAGQSWSANTLASLGNNYVGPCLRPAEVAQREREAELKALERAEQLCLTILRSIDAAASARALANCIHDELARRREETGT